MFSQPKERFHADRAQFQGDSPGHCEVGSDDGHLGESIVTPADSPEGGRHRIRVGVATFDEDLLASYIARSERTDDPEDDSTFHRF